MKAAPCKNCLERQYACFWTCEKYKKWRSDLEKIKEEKRKSQVVDAVMFRWYRRDKK